MTQKVVVHDSSPPGELGRVVIEIGEHGKGSLYLTLNPRQLMDMLAVHRGHIHRLEGEATSDEHDGTTYIHIPELKASAR